MALAPAVVQARDRSVVRFFLKFKLQYAGFMTPFGNINRKSSATEQPGPAQFIITPVSEFTHSAARARPIQRTYYDISATTEMLARWGCAIYSRNRCVA